MKKTTDEGLGCAMWVIGLVLLMFLFWGEPDVFDALRAGTIHAIERMP